MPTLYATAHEEALHSHAIQALAVETGHAPALVRTVWERELAALAADARIRDYLPIFTLRKAREALALQPLLAARADAPLVVERQPPVPARRSSPRRWHWISGRGLGKESRPVSA